jgi:uncharacterized protein involved in exopolysaccharide biosynthesis
LTTPRPRPTEPLSVSAPFEPVRSNPPGRDTEEFSVISLVNSALRNRWLILIIALAGGAYEAYKGLRAPRLYTTEAQFMPKGSRGQTQIQGLAQQFGIAVGSSDAAQSPAFYMDLLESRPLLADVAKRQYRVRTDKGLIAGTLPEIYGIRSNTPEVVKSNVVNRLKGQIDEANSIRTGVITVTVHAKYPELAVQIAQALLDQVNAFNLNRRQEQASAERVFIEGRLADAQSALSQAEDNLQSFLTENREFKSSPALTLEFDRLNRAVGSRQALYNSLATSYEQAKIDEVRDLPVITVIEPPELPILPDSRGGKRKVLLGVLVGLVIGIIIAFARDRLAANRDVRSDEFQEFAELKRDAIDEIIHPWRRFSRILGSRTRS